MFEETPKRIRIIAELIRRLQEKYPDTLLDRGFFADEVTVFPSMYVFEDTEGASSTPTARRGMYEKTLPVIVSYFVKGIRQDDLYEKGNLLLAELQHNIEQDELFREGGEGGPNLVIRYGMTDDTLVLYAENVINVELTYNFVYSELAPWAKQPRRRS